MITVKDFMNPKFLVVPPEQTVEATAWAMISVPAGSAVVMKDGELVGILTERDILFAVARGTNLADSSVADRMTRYVVTVEPNAELIPTIRMMQEGKFRHLPVMRDGEVIGMLSIRDLLRAAEPLLIQLEAMIGAQAPATDG